MVGTTESLLQCMLRLAFKSWPSDIDLKDVQRQHAYAGPDGHDAIDDSA